MRISIANITVFSIYIFSIVGILPLYYHWVDYRIEMGVIDETIIFNLLTFSGINIIFLIFGVIFLRKFLGKKNQVIIPKDLIYVSLNKKQIFLFFGFFLLVIAAIFYTVAQIDKIPLFLNFRLNNTNPINKYDINLARSHFYDHLGLHYHWIKFLTHDLSQFLSYIIFANWLIARSRSNFILLCFAFLTTAFALLMTAEKAPFLYFLIGHAFVYFCIKNKGYFSWQKSILILAILFTVSSCMYIYFMHTSNVLISIFSRVFTGTIAPAYFYLQLFPKHIDFLYGMTFPNPGGFLPFDPIPFTKIIKYYMNSKISEIGIIGSAPTVFWGESYINFGLFGVVVISFIFGAWISYVESIVSKLKFNILTVSFFVWLILHFSVSCETGISQFIADSQLFALSVIFFTMYKLFNLK